MKEEREHFKIEVNTYNNKQFYIKCFRLPNNEARPVILFPGFYQNGFFWDVIPGEGSLAEYLHNSGMDVWVIHQRGTGGSGGWKFKSSLDDYAASDVPSIIDFVKEKTGKKPVFVGHSQGGITAIMSMMGAVQDNKGKVALSKEVAEGRQNNLHALITMGSFLNFTWPKDPSIAKFVKHGLKVKIFGKEITIIKSIWILKAISIFRYMPIPVPISLRETLLNNKFWKIVLAPLIWILNWVSYSGMWSFLYHTPNVTKKERRYLFYRTMDATFWGIINQFYWAIRRGQMYSTYEAVNYSAHYEWITLPYSCVAMQFDTIENAENMKTQMFDHMGSKVKHFTLWKDQGHEDFVMNPKYFPNVKEIIKQMLEE